MRPGFIRIAVVTTLCGGLTGAVLGAQVPAGPNNGVQVAVPQGNASDQAQDAARQRQAQATRNRLANQPAPRSADGHIVIGNTAAVKGVWIGSSLGFCNSNTVQAAPSLNPGAGPGPRRRRGPGRCSGGGSGRRGPRRRGGAVHPDSLYGVDASGLR